MTHEYSQFEQRKQDHMQFALDAQNQAIEMNMLDTVNLRHEALPDLNFVDVSIKTHRWGREVKKPFLVSSMTAGHQQAEMINRHLLEACQYMDWAMGVGSQRRELTDPEAALEWQPLKRDFPNVSLFGNLGIAQLIETPLNRIQRLIDALSADALIIHCNPLQELIQPEGTPQFKGCWDAIAALVKVCSVPVIVKETGCGFSLPTLTKLSDLGVAAVDVSGLGGTHWGRIEGQRNPADSLLHRAALTYRNWGVDTVTSIKHASSLKPCYEIWGSGGVRHGLDAAKLFALGVSTVGFAKPMLEAALKGSQDVIDLMQLIEYELKIALFCTGSECLADLKGKIC